MILQSSNYIVSLFCQKVFLALSTINVHKLQMCNFNAPSSLISIVYGSVVFYSFLRFMCLLLCRRLSSSQHEQQRNSNHKRNNINPPLENESNCRSIIDEKILNDNIDDHNDLLFCVDYDNFDDEGNDETVEKNQQRHKQHQQSQRNCYDQKISTPLKTAEMVTHPSTDTLLKLIVNFPTPKQSKIGISSDDMIEINEKSILASSPSSSTIMSANKKMLCNTISIHAPILLFFLSAFLQFESVYFKMLASKRATLQSILILDNIDVLMIMLLSKIILGRTYHKLHFLSLGFCLLGLIIGLWSTTIPSSNFESLLEGEGHKVKSQTQNPIPAKEGEVVEGSLDISDQVLGNFFAICGGICSGMFYIYHIIFSCPFFF